MSIQNRVSFKVLQPYRPWISIQYIALTSLVASREFIPLHRATHSTQSTAKGSEFAYMAAHHSPVEPEKSIERGESTGPANGPVQAQPHPTHRLAFSATIFSASRLRLRPHITSVAMRNPHLCFFPVRRVLFLSGSSGAETLGFFSTMETSVASPLRQYVR